MGKQRRRKWKSGNRRITVTRKTIVLLPYYRNPENKVNLLSPLLLGPVAHHHHTMLAYGTGEEIYPCSSAGVRLMHTHKPV